MEGRKERGYYKGGKVQNKAYLALKICLLSSPRDASPPTMD